MNGSLGGSRVAIRHPRARNNRASAHLRRLQFLPAGLAEIPQRIDFVDQLGQVDRCSVGREIGLNDQSARLLCRIIHTIARQYFQPADERIQADHFRDLGLVVYERIGVEPPGFLNEGLVELLTPGTGSCRSAVVILPALRMAFAALLPTMLMAYGTNSEGQLFTSSYPFEPHDVD
jgi:hypothetical protein